jgi:hypothetical protein
VSSPAGIKARRSGQRPLRLGIDCQPFYIPKCANQACKAPLANSAGNPRWDLLEGRFVCLGMCRQVRKAGPS